MISPLLLNDRWTVRNCELSEGANAVYSIASTVKYAHLSPNKLTVENNFIHDIGDTGDGNFYDGDSHAVGIQGGSDHLIQNNVIEKTGSSIVLFSNPGQIMRDNIIRNNVLIDIYAQASYGGVAIALSGFTEAPLGERTGNKFYNNIVLGAQGSGMTSNAPDLVQIYNNLFYNIDKAGFAAFSKSGSKYLGRNNMFVDVEDYYLSINYETIPGEPFLEWDHNLYFNDTPKDTYAFYYLPTGRKYLTSWIEDPPYDDHAVADDPYLETPEDPSTEILDEPYFHISEQMVRLAENSPAIDAGFDMQRESDVYGNLIYGRPDIGPVEYQPGHVMGEPLGAETTVYADGKFRIASNAIQADLAVSPAGGWPTFALTEHRPQWMKIQVQQWQRRLEWVETVSSPESVTHTVGGRDPNVYCQVYIDDGLVSSQTPDANGDITFTSHLKAGDRHVKVLFWDEPVTVQVLQGGHPVEGAPVYLFSPGGTYLGHHGVTDGSGEVSFLLPVGESFEFRADLLGSQYFSGAFTVTEGATPLL